MPSGDIRDRILKLSEIAPNFGRFLLSQILGRGGVAPKTLYRSGDIRHRSLRLSEVDPDFARFGPHIFWGVGANFGTGLLDYEDS